MSGIYILIICMHSDVGWTFAIRSSWEFQIPLILV